MAGAAETYAVVADRDVGRQAGGEEFFTATSWRELLQYDAPESGKYQRYWVEGTEEQVAREQRLRQARERGDGEGGAARAGGQPWDDVLSDFGSASAEGEEEEEAGSAEDETASGEDVTGIDSFLRSAGAAVGSRKKRARVDDGAASADKEGEEEGEDLAGLAGTFGNALALLNGRAAPNPSFAPARSASHTFVSLLLVRPADAGGLSLTVDPTLVKQSTGQPLFYITLNPLVEDRPLDASLYSGPHVSSVHAFGDVYGRTRSLLWTALGSVLRLQQELRDAVVNVRLRLRLGRKVFPSKSYFHDELCKGCGEVAGAKVVSAERLCSAMNRDGAAESEFRDNVSASEYARILHRLETVAPPPTFQKASTVVQIHGLVTVPTSSTRPYRVSVRVTCELDAETERLRVLKIKHRSSKHAVVDVMRPEGYDFRYDVRTTVSVAPSSQVYRCCEEVMRCLTFHAGTQLLAAFEKPPHMFTVYVVRFKQKQQFHRLGCGAGAQDGATKVSLSHTQQHEYARGQFRSVDAEQVFEPCVSSDRYEAGVQLLSTKHLFDAFKKGQLELGAGVSAKVMDFCQYLVPHGLAALQQIPTEQAVAEDTALREKALLSKANAVLSRRAHAAKEESDSDDGMEDDEV